MRKYLLIVLGGVGAFLVLAMLYLGWLAPDYSLTTQVEVDASVEESFAYYSNPFNLSLWVNSEDMTYEGMEHVSGFPNDIGSQWKLFFKSEGQEFSVVQTVTEFELDSAIGFNIKDSDSDYDLRVTFETKNGKTVLTEVFTEGEDMSFLGRARANLLSGTVASQKQAMYARLKANIEAS